jgi:endoglucanase
MASNATMLRCDGDKIVDGEGKQVILRGVSILLQDLLFDLGTKLTDYQACLGGYLLQENFTNGFPGQEKAYRAAMLKVLGQEKYDFFWSKFYQYCELGPT